MENNDKISFEDFKREIIEDYRIANLSRQLSVLGRREVLTGKAKFGIFGDGKEIAQIAMAKVFRNGDWRSGYYRDQTFMMAAGLLAAEEFFYQLYGETDVNLNPGECGRVFNNHFATRNINQDGSWKNLTEQKNSSADLSPTAGHFPRIAGLGLASKLYRLNKDLAGYSIFSDNGNEVVFGTIGDASTSEGHFWETINACGVLQIPVALSIWDDGYGISVPKKYQTTKQSISEALKGFEIKGNDKGYLIYKENGWNYSGLIKMYQEGIKRCREEHIPVIFHIQEMTQPLGHSTSGSHERYKPKERLEWETNYDPIKKFKEWIIETNIASEEELKNIEETSIKEATDAKNTAWTRFRSQFETEKTQLIQLIEGSNCPCPKQGQINKVKLDLNKIINPIRKDIISSAKKILRYTCQTCSEKKPLKNDLINWINKQTNEGYERYSSCLYCETDRSALKVKEVKATYNENSAIVSGREVLRDNWDYLLNKYPLLCIFGEDVGYIGGVNQTYEGLQKKYGELRISDTGIRETTILGQGIGMALRGMRPVAEMQYFDYLLYALQTMSDDLATTMYRTKGGQKVPLIITTRGHRLEGIWHSGSPLSMVINSIRGVYICVPRNMTQAAGFYNTLLEGDDPALVIEPLNGYRLKETRPDNIGEYKVPLGVPEILNEGTDITLVTYGSCVRIAQDAIEQLKEFNINVELIDVQTLLPFDINHIIVESIKKTNKILFFDEDVPGGATAYMMQKVIEEHGGFYYLDSEPKTLSAKEHRPAYTTDGDYFSNPNAENVFDTVYNIMYEANPIKYPKMF